MSELFEPLKYTDVFASICNDIERKLSLYSKLLSSSPSIHTQLADCLDAFGQFKQQMQAVDDQTAAMHQVLDTLLTKLHALV
jgi:hypothetical protein